MYKSIRLIR